MTIKETYTGLYSQQAFLNSLNFLGFGPDVHIDKRHNKITFADPNDARNAIVIDTKDLDVHNGQITSGTIVDVHAVIGGKDAVTLTGASIDATQLNSSLSGDVSGLYDALVGGLHGNIVATGDKFGNILEIGQGGKATVDAGGGNDLLEIWHAKNAVIDGGTGADTIDFNSYFGFPSPPVSVATVDLAAGTGTNPYGGTLTINNIENLDNFIGTSDFRGDGQDNDFRGGSHADTFIGRGGDDEISIWINVSADPRATVVDGGSGKDTLVAQLSDAPAAPMSGSGDSLRLLNRLDLLHPEDNTGTFHGGTFKHLEVFRVNGFLNKNVFDFSGTSASEHVFSAGSDDPLNGRGGDDLLYGADGADILTGGSGADTFQYRAATESAANPALRDTVTDFSHAQHDRIDLHLIDADTTGGGNDKFKFMNSGGFDGHAGEVYAERANGDTFVFADTNGDKAPDLVILVDGGPKLAEGDFIL